MIDAENSRPRPAKNKKEVAPLPVLLPLTHSLVGRIHSTGPVVHEDIRNQGNVNPSRLVTVCGMLVA